MSASKIFGALFLFVAMSSFVCVSYAASPKTLRVSNLDARGNVMSQLVEKTFIPYIEKNSDGRYKIDYYPDSALGNAETIVQGLEMGTVDIAFDTVSNFDQFCPSLGLLDLPYIFEGGDLSKLSESPMGEKLRNMCAASDLKIIDMHRLFPRNLISRKPARDLAEMQNLKIRTTGSKWQMLGAEAMGMKPVPIPASEMLTAIQQGMVDCIDMVLPSMLNFHIVDVAKNVTLTDQAQIMGVVVCSNEFWNNLSEEDKKLFTDAAIAYREAQNKMVDESTDTYVKKLEEAGATVYKLDAAEKEKLEKVTRANLEKELDPENRALLNEILAAVQ